MSYSNSVSARNITLAFLVALIAGFNTGCATKQMGDSPDSTTGAADQKSAAPAARVVERNADNAINFNPHPETKVDKYSHVDDSAIAP